MGAPTVATLWYVTPAWRRFALSAVCFEQRRRVIDELARRGIEARCVVIADDENLELARAAGFDTIERDNEFLGRRFNDGYEYALTHGAGWIAPLGSDSWVDVDYFDPLPTGDAIQTATYLCTVAVDRLAHLEVQPNHGGGPYLIPRALFERSHPRPAGEFLKRGTDRSLIDGLGLPISWTLRDLHRFQHVSFRAEPHITDYHRLWYHWGVAEEYDPWDQLPEYYPADLVAAAQKAVSC